MAPELFKVSVPGSIMLMGEHAVLHGKQAIVCAVDKRLHMQLKPLAQNTIVITDSRLGSLQIDLDNIEVQAPFKFVLCAILLFKDQLKTGFELTVNSDFPSTIGFGSSAAVTVATIAVLSKWLDVIPLSEDQIFAKAKQVILDVQGSGSGADVAASVYGGVLGFCYSSQADAEFASSRPRQSHCRSSRDLPTITKLPIIPPLVAIYSGYKTPTPEVIRIVNAAANDAPSKFATIFSSIHTCVLEAIAAIRAQDWPLLGRLLKQNYKLQVELGTSDAKLDELVNALNAQDHIYGAKISGAGLGDCVIGLTRHADQTAQLALQSSAPQPAPQLALQSSSSQPAPQLIIKSTSSQPAPQLAIKSTSSRPRRPCAAVAGIHFPIIIDPQGLICK